MIVSPSVFEKCYCSVKMFLLMHRKLHQRKEYIHVHIHTLRSSESFLTKNTIIRMLIETLMRNLQIFEKLMYNLNNIISYIDYKKTALVCSKGLYHYTCLYESQFFWNNKHFTILLNWFSRGLIHPITLSMNLSM